MTYLSARPQGRRFGGVAQLVEQRPFKPQVQGSSPCTPTVPERSLIVLHAVFSAERVHLWAEGENGTPESPHTSNGDTGVAPSHPSALDATELAAVLGSIGIVPGGARPDRIALLLPSVQRGPLASPKLAHWTGHGAHEESGGDLLLRSWNVETVSLDASESHRVLAVLEEIGEETESNLLDEVAGHERARRAHYLVGDSVRYFAAAARFALSLMAEQRFVPSVAPMRVGPPEASWSPWLSDESVAERTSLLVGGMPPIVRAVDDELEHDPATILQAFLRATVDGWCRRVLEREEMVDALEDWDAAADPHVGWLTGLLADRRRVIAGGDAHGASLVRTVRQWIGRLEERGAGGEWRLLLRLNEPFMGGAPMGMVEPGDDIRWTLTFHLSCVESEQLVVDAEDIWALRGDSASIEGHRLESPQDLLLAELGRASRVFPKLEGALESSAPTEMDLSTREAYEFLREVQPLLADQGFGVEAPAWWDSASARLGARLQLMGGEKMPDGPMGPGATPDAEARIGLRALVSYQWQLAVGETPLTMEDFERLAAMRAPLVFIDGRWVEIRREDLDHAVRFIRENPGGEMRVGDALRMAYTSDLRSTGIPILGIDAQGWVADLLRTEEEGGGGFAIIQPPVGFKGDLRPYQLKGLSWLTFLDRLGLGPCLADDMGLGKTIQLLALLLYEREHESSLPGGGEPVNPTLIVVPMSIVGNWVREAKRFAPALRVLVHHGVERQTGDSFFAAAGRSDVVITTYALAHRDRDLLQCVRWGRVVLDEAQNIKNPSAKQSQAVRSLDAERRVALTGTPLENRLSELWSILDFCNPGLLGSAGEFRRSFSVPIERYRDKQRAGQLRKLVRPFILRRLKTDPTVISDLPEKVETKEYCRLTAEQAELYESCVKTMLEEVDHSEGIRRRGIVLTTLVRLKQVCNHPALLLKEAVGNGKGSENVMVSATRSGKCIRMLEMLDEVVAAGDHALVFTQFRQMGHLLASLLRQTLDREVLFLHGGTPSAQREAMIDRFQKGDGSTPIFVLSLKAGGVGLNLTAASHVFHFDRWWNPAVENQATDRAFRIGQKRTVNVHKFVVSGTLEERIDQMIESKIALAEDVIGSGEDWLTELSTQQLRDVLALRREDAMMD